MRAPSREASTVNGDDTTTSQPTTDVATIHCTETCKYGRKDTVDMVRCCMCFIWFHEDGLGNYAPSSDENWWICGACRKMTQTIAGIADTVGKLYGMVETFSNDNTRLRNEVKEFKSSNSLISAPLQSLKDFNSKQAMATLEILPSRISFPAYFSATLPSGILLPMKTAISTYSQKVEQKLLIFLTRLNEPNVVLILTSSFMSARKTQLPSSQ